MLKELGGLILRNSVLPDSESEEEGDSDSELVEVEEVVPADPEAEAGLNDEGTVRRPVSDLGRLARSLSGPGMRTTMRWETTLSRRGVGVSMCCAVEEKQR